MTAGKYMQCAAFNVPYTDKEWQEQNDRNVEHIRAYEQRMTNAQIAKYKASYERFKESCKPLKCRPVHRSIFGPRFKEKDMAKAEAWCQDMVFKRKAQQASFYDEYAIHTCNKSLVWITKVKNLPSYTKNNLFRKNRAFDTREK